MNWLSMVPDEENDLLSVRSPAAVKPGKKVTGRTVAPPALGVRDKDYQKMVDRNKELEELTEKQRRDLKNSTTVNRLYRPDEVADQFDMLRNLPEFKASLSPTEDLEKMITMQRESPIVDEAAWLKPLIALTDSQTGSKLMQGYTEPTSNKDRMSILLKYQNELAERKANNAKSLLEGLGKLKAGTDVNQILVGTDTSRKTGTTQEAVSEDFTGQNIHAPPKGAGADGQTDWQKTFNRTQAKGWGDWLQKGGFQEAEEDIHKLEKAEQILEKNKGKMVGASGFGQSVLNTIGVGKMNTDATEVKKLVDEVSVKGVKGTFPGNVSNYESKSIKDLKFDPGVDEALNLKLVKEAKKAKMMQLERAKRVLQHAQQHGRVDNYNFYGDDPTVEKNANMIKVKNKVTGKTGLMPKEKFNPEKYEEI